MKDSHHPITVDIISDVVCPWCVIGFKQLEKAAIATRTPLSVHWHAYEINPYMAPEGENLRDHIAAKYGSSSKDGDRARQKLTRIGADLGFSFNYTDEMRVYNSFKAHQLLCWAGEHGGQTALKLALFDAFFTRRQDISADEVLLDAVAAAGIDRDQATLILADEAYAKTVREEQDYWRGQGIQGVPAMIFNKKHLVTGAQGAENYTKILHWLHEQAHSGLPQ